MDEYEHEIKLEFTTKNFISLCLRKEINKYFFILNILFFSPDKFEEYSKAQQLWIGVGLARSKKGTAAKYLFSTAVMNLKALIIGCFLFCIQKFYGFIKDFFDSWLMRRLFQNINTNFLNFEE